MDLQQTVALAVFVGVYALFATRLVHRAVAALVGALVLAVGIGFGPVVSSIIPDVLLVTAGLMVLAGSVKRSGIAAWLALRAAKAARGRPNRILVLTGLLSFVLGALLGPATSVVLVVPVALLLAVELDVSALPFVVILSWTALLGGATTLTAHPSNLWIASALGIDSATWLVRVAPLTLASLVATLVTGLLVFNRRLRVTNERRARVLEYDEARTLGGRTQIAKTATAVGLVIVGMVFGPLISVGPAVAMGAGAILLLLWEGPRSVDQSLSDLDGPSLVFYGGLCAVVGVLGTSGLGSLVAAAIPADPILVLGGSAVLGAFIDHGAVAAALVPILQSWSLAGASGVWPFVVLGTVLGAGATIWGSVSNATALGLAGQGSRAIPRRDFTRYGLLFAVVNVVVVAILGFLLPH